MSSCPLDVFAVEYKTVGEDYGSRCQWFSCYIRDEHWCRSEELLSLGEGGGEQQSMKNWGQLHWGTAYSKFGNEQILSIKTLTTMLKHQLEQVVYFAYFTHYRPQRSCGKVMFSQASVILFTGGVCPSACWDTHTPGRHPPRKHTTPGSTLPPEGTPPWEAQPPEEHPPPTDGHCSRWYESYSNAFLF